MDQFQKGYIAGWRAVTGETPINVPPSPTPNDTDAYMVGFSRGKRDATEMAGDAKTY
jgi:hypothetical protein